MSLIWEKVTYRLIAIQRLEKRKEGIKNFVYWTQNEKTPMLYHAYLKSNPFIGKSFVLTGKEIVLDVLYLHISFTFYK